MKKTKKPMMRVEYNETIIFEELHIWLEYTGKFLQKNRQNFSKISSDFLLQHSHMYIF